MTEARAVDDERLSELAGGVFFRCDESCQAILSGGAALATKLGVGPGDLGAGLGPALGRDSPALYAEILEGAAGRGPASLLPYDHPTAGKRWLSLRRAAAPDAEGAFLAFLRDETAFMECRLAVAAARSRDVENSARLQAALLMEGRRLSIPGVDYQTATIPSKLVDGDFIDVLGLSPDSADFVLGDVMGKGMDAAVLGATIKLGFARALATLPREPGRLPDPAEICARAEADVAPRLLERQSFATLTYARLDRATRSFRFVDCGHSSIIHYAARTRECWLVKGANMPLGFSPRQDYRSFAFPFESGDALLLYTDGLSECCNREGEALGEERIAHMLRGHLDRPASELAGLIMKLGFDYSASGFNDDVSLVCVKDGGPAPEGLRERSVALDLEGGGLSRLGEAESLFGADLEDWAAGAGAGPRAALALAFHEAATNLAEHAPAPGAEPSSARWRLAGGLFSIELEYTGPDYDWLSEPRSPVAEYAASGYGRLIMREGTDSILLARGFRGRKRLVMCRDLSARGGEG